MSTLKPADSAPETPRPADATAATRPQRKKMSMALVNFWLDAALLVTVVFAGWLTVVLQVVFPAPTYAGGWTLWGLTYNQWHMLQFGAICFCAFVILFHVMLHWNWVCSIIAAQVLRLQRRPDDGLQTIYGVATMIVLLGSMLAGLIAAVLTVKSP